MPRAEGLDAARLLIDIIDYPKDQHVRLIFALIMLELGRNKQLELAPESHGVMQAMGVFRGNDWCYSFKPTQEWVTVWLRRPEMRLFPHKAALFESAYPDFGSPSHGELTARLVSPEQAMSFVEIVSAS